MKEPKFKSIKPLGVAQVMYRLGAKDAEVAEALGVSRQALDSWKNRHPEYVDELAQAKAVADKVVEQSLFARAKGYNHPDVDIRVIEGQIVKTALIKHYPPDTTACIFWLKNRKPAEWRDVQAHILSNPDGSRLIPQATLEAAALLAKGLPEASATVEAEIVPDKNKVA